jgi:hypothetical protein
MNLPRLVGTNHLPSHMGSFNHFFEENWGVTDFSNVGKVELSEL